VIINLLTDAPKHNLALMKISAYHKSIGDTVNQVNMPLMPADKTYASWLYDFSSKYPSDVEGGTACDLSTRLPDEIQDMKPDYSVFPVDYSIGYTWEYCPRKCEFCKVPGMNTSRIHRSIWSFHEPKFKIISLLNNNTFTDPHWKETFEEIWDANLTVIDQSGWDIRLLDDEKAEALKETKFINQPKFAWDFMKDEAKVLKGFEVARKCKLNAMVYILMGFDTTFEEDIYRCQMAHDFGFDPFPMLYKPTEQLRLFRRMIYLRYYRKYKTIEEAWKNYK